MFEQDIHLKNKGEESNCSSVMISPTFQANNVISLKDELFKDDKNGKGYVEVNLNLREVAKKDPVEINQNDFEGNG